MKKAIIALLISLMLVMTVAVMARPAKETYDGKTAGNSGFANVVDNNFPDNDVTGWVRYSKDAKALHSTWVVDGLEPNTEYQLKLQTNNGDSRVRDACGAPNTGAIWQCGDWGSDTFLVMATVTSNSEGHIGASVKEDRLPSGDYDDAQFSVIENSAPWSSAWTWEQEDWQVGPWRSSFTIK